MIEILGRNPACLFSIYFLFIMRRRLFIYYLTQKSLPDSMVYQAIQISGLLNKESNSARRLFVK